VRGPDRDPEPVRRFECFTADLHCLADWLKSYGVKTVAVESTAQYWKPLWSALERYWKPSCHNREGAGKMSGTLHLAQALSNRGRRGRKKDFWDAERFGEAAGFPGADFELCARYRKATVETLTRTRYQRTGDKVRLQNQLEALLEEAHVKSSLVSDLLGRSARRMLHALADGETDPTVVAALAHQRLRATSAEFCDALGACTELNPVYRRLVRLALDDLQLIEQQIGQLDQEIASLLREHQDPVQRLAEVPGLGVDSAQPIIAEVGAKAATFASPRIWSRG
jgi:transposase